MKRMLTLLAGGALCALLSTGGAMAQETGFTKPMGDMSTTLLAEMQNEGDKSLLIGADEAMEAKYLSNGKFPMAINAFLVRLPNQNILVDTGLGQGLEANLKQTGLSYDDIDAVLITHMHGDHVGGLLKDGKAAFAKAQIWIAKPELAYWTDQNIMQQQPENQRGGFQTSMDIAKAYGDRIQLFEPGALALDGPSVMPGVRPLAAFGHTPGHTMFLVEQQGQPLLFWGDLTHAMAIQMPQPQVALVYDTDPQQAIKTRKDVLAWIAQNQLAVAGQHIPAPGMGTIKSDGNQGYVFTAFSK